MYHRAHKKSKNVFEKLGPRRHSLDFALVGFSASPHTAYPVFIHFPTNFALSFDLSPSTSPFLHQTSLRLYFAHLFGTHSKLASSEFTDTRHLWHSMWSKQNLAPSSRSTFLSLLPRKISHAFLSRKRSAIFRRASISRHRFWGVVVALFLAHNTIEQIFSV